LDIGDIITDDSCIGSAIIMASHTLVPFGTSGILRTKGERERERERERESEREREEGETMRQKVEGDKTEEYIKKEEARKNIKRRANPDSHRHRFLPHF
jgi:hypothetical protein